MTEHRAEEKRQWVRLTWTCNNRCIFCHDCECHDGTRRPVAELEEELRAGLAEGAARLILSGGEPTLHPAFLDLVARGRELGYRWVQVVSNGRMFAYPGFARSAAERGLCEATFSIHGHTPELHDRLTGVPGSFTQALAGLHNLQRTGRVVVNVDLVVNAWNLPVLPEILGFFLDQGIREFDLLWLVPFGRAWERRGELFVRPADAAPDLRRAIVLAQQAGATVWTNRLPPAALEGLEVLLQDPHKLLDEVRGRRAELSAWLTRGEPMICRSAERCPFCFLSGFCGAVEGWLGQIREGRLRGLRMAWEQRELPVVRSWARRVQRWWINTPVPGETVAWLADNAPGAEEVVLELGETALGPRLSGLPAGVRLASGDPACLEAMLTGTSGEIEVILDRRSAAWIADRAAVLGRASDRVVFSLRRFGSREEVRALGCDPALALAPLARPGLRLRGVPACAANRAELLPRTVSLAPEALREDGGLDLTGIAEHYLREEYNVFSARCAPCTLRSRCPGLPAEHARCWGLDRLRPGITDFDAGKAR